MQRILSPLLSLLLAILFHPHLIGMDQPITTINHVYKIPELRDHVINNLFPHAFNAEDTPAIINYALRSIGCVNHNLHQLVHTKDITQFIIDKISKGCNQDYWARNIATPGMRNYLNQSGWLYKHIAHIKTRTINYSLKNGADINYCPGKKRPLLFKALKNYNSTKLLLDHGVNLNVIYHKKTALQRMVESNNCVMIKLILSYNPHNTCLPIAVLAKNYQLIRLILQHNNTSLDELNESLAIAIQNEDGQTIKDLMDSGAQLRTVINNVKKKSEETLSPQENSF